MDIKKLRRSWRDTFQQFSKASKPRRRRNMKVPFWMAAALPAAAGLLAYRKVARKRSAYSFQGKSVIIAGGSRGLGLVLARLLAEEGANLTLLARDTAELQRAESDLLGSGAQVNAWPCDLRDQSQVEEAFGRVVRMHGKIDVLIYTAGIIQVGPLDHMLVDDFRDAMETHFWGPLYSMLAARHYMKQSGGGRIVNVSSIGGKVAVPHLAPYSASKFALTGLSDAVRAEFDRNNVSVTTVIPGLMRTASFANAFFKGKHRDEYAWFSILDSLPVTSISAESAARQIIEACRWKKNSLTISPQARLLEITSSIAPGLVGWGMKTMNRFLPKPNAGRDPANYTGWESQSEKSPSPLTQLSDRKVEDYNEAYPSSLTKDER
jgi:NAD(P)-dependent dehydrogenase (short-subunit alcohol dehydrogenase family)